MKNAQIVTAREIKVQINGVKSQSWARIVDAKTKEILHTGSLPYIKRVASVKYNKAISV